MPRRKESPSGLVEGRQETSRHIQGRARPPMKPALLVNALLRAAQVVIALSLTPTPSPILPFVVRDVVTVYRVKLDYLAPTQQLPQSTLG
jgi:hypothetical protein